VVEFSTLASQIYADVRSLKTSKRGCSKFPKCHFAYSTGRQPFSKIAPKSASSFPSRIFPWGLQKRDKCSGNVDSPGGSCWRRIASIVKSFECRSSLYPESWLMRPFCLHRSAARSQLHCAMVLCRMEVNGISFQVGNWQKRSLFFFLFRNFKKKFFFLNLKNKSLGSVLHCYIIITRDVFIAHCISLISNYKEYYYVLR